VYEKVHDVVVVVNDVVHFFLESKFYDNTRRSLTT
jgi:hypothetical protein